MKGVCYLDIIIEVDKLEYDMGEVSGVVPEAFTILRQLLDRLTNPKTGEVIIKELNNECPKNKEAEAEYLA